MQINIKNIVKLDKNNRIAIKGFRKYAKQGALVCVEEIDEFTYKIFLLNKGELIGDKITE